MRTILRTCPKCKQRQNAILQFKASLSGWEAICCFPKCNHCWPVRPTKKELKGLEELGAIP